MGDLRLMTGQEPKYWRKSSVSRAALQRISFSEGNFGSTSRSFVSKKSVKPSRSCTSSCLHTASPFSYRWKKEVVLLAWNPVSHYPECEISAYHNHMCDSCQASISSHQRSEEHSTGAEGQHRLGRDPAVTGKSAVSRCLWLKARSPQIHITSGWR